MNRIGVVAAIVAGTALPLGVLGVAGVAAAADGAAWLIFGFAVAIPALVLGPAVALRTGNAVGIALAAAGLAIVLTVAGDAYLRGAAQAGLPTSVVLVAMSAGAWMLLFAPWIWVLLLFPTGRLERRLDRIVAATITVVAVAFDLLAIVAPAPYPEPWEASPHPWGVWGPADVLAPALLPVFLACLIAAPASVVLRYRRARGPERRQLRWLSVAAFAVPSALLFLWVTYFLFGGAEVVLVAVAVFCVAIPLSIGAALLTATDADVWIVRVVSWCVLLLALVGIVAGATALGARIPGGAALIAAATAAVAVLGTIAGRAPLERAVGAVIFPRTARTVDELRIALEQVHRGDTPPEQVTEILRRGMRDPSLVVEFAGDAVATDRTVTPVTLAGSRIATIAGRPGAELVPQRVVAAAAPLIELVRLRAELARALRDAERSRARLVRAETEERRRLERDLHDGAQQRLVSLGMSLRLAQRHAVRGELDVDRALDDAITAVAASVADLRAVAHGLRPSSLDDGLPAALADLSSTAAVPVEVNLRGAPIPDTVGTTAYYVASEGVANAVKHAHAADVAVSVEQDAAALHVRVIDNGGGGAAVTPGGGLAGLSDRVRAIGGTLRVDSPIGGGTTLWAELPCAS